MTRNIWISSDLHYNHANILKFQEQDGKPVRTFDNVDQMNECLIECHNSVVKPGDIHYNLGDVFFGNIEKFKADWPKFNGQKRLIVGNHDNIKILSQGSFFAKISMWRMFTEYNLMLSHVPLHVSNLLRMNKKDGIWPDDCVPLYNIHGHIHRKVSPQGPYRNVSVEMINYTPVHIEDLAKEAKSYLGDKWNIDKQNMEV